MATPTFRRPLSLCIQRNLLALAYPYLICEVRKDTLVWEGSLQPTPLSRRYRLRIQYKMGKHPRIFAVEPNLRVLAVRYGPERKLPHVYSEDPARLCVYHPCKREWHPACSLAATIVPWSITWLSFFEDWLVTDIWSGGGEHPAHLESQFISAGAFEDRSIRTREEG